MEAVVFTVVPAGVVALAGMAVDSAAPVGVVARDGAVPDIAGLVGADRVGVDPVGADPVGAEAIGGVPGAAVGVALVGAGVARDGGVTDGACPVGAAAGAGVAGVSASASLPALSWVLPLRSPAVMMADVVILLPMVAMRCRTVTAMQRPVMSRTIPIPTDIKALFPSRALKRQQGVHNLLTVTRRL